MKIEYILDCIHYVSFEGDITTDVSKVVPIKTAFDRTSLTWMNCDNLYLLPMYYMGTIIVPNMDLKGYIIHEGVNIIKSKNPRNTFREVLEMFSNQKNEISKTAIIENSTIGKNCSIGHNSVIMNAEIGDNVIIGCNCTIGGTGFGYEKDENGNYQLIPHIGNVILKDWVEIGNNTCIDRAVMGSTILEENVKVDNLVHIAHGVHIKKNSVIIANAMIAGSVEIGENTWVAPSANILNKKKVGNNAVIGMGAVVLKDVNDNETIIGNPGKLLVK